MNNSFDSDDEAPEPPSKSEIKRQMHALQSLGKQLAELSDVERAKIPMPSELSEAIDTYNRIKSREAQRRQMQFIGKVMRDIDTAEIESALDKKQRGDTEAQQAFIELEKLRERLITEGDTAIQSAVEMFPDADRQHLRQLVKNAQRERSQEKPPTSARKLFRYLRELSEQD